MFTVCKIERHIIYTTQTVEALDCHTSLNHGGWGETTQEWRYSWLRLELGAFARKLK